jgi:hypothetical protein
VPRISQPAVSSRRDSAIAEYPRPKLNSTPGAE